MPSQDILDLTKKLSVTFELNLEKADILSIPPMDTKLSVDRSGSMGEEFSCGWVDKAIDLFIVAALKFDSNGRLEIGFFNDSYTRTPDATVEDVGSRYTVNHKIKPYNGTLYTEAIVQMANKPSATGMIGRMFGKAGKATPSYHGMITDGDASDFKKFAAEVKAMDPRNFLQIIAIGNEVKLELGQGLADSLPNVAFIHIPNPHQMTPENFYQQICHDKLAKWIKTL